MRDGRGIGRIENMSTNKLRTVATMAGLMQIMIKLNKFFLMVFTSSSTIRKLSTFKQHFCYESMPRQGRVFGRRRSRHNIYSVFFAMVSRRRYDDADGDDPTRPSNSSVKRGSLQLRPSERRRFDLKSDSNPNCFNDGSRDDDRNATIRSSVKRFAAAPKRRRRRR